VTRITGILHEDQYVFFIASRSVILRMRNVADKSCRENQTTHFMSSNFFNIKSCRLWYNVEECRRAGLATYNNMAHVHCMLDN